MLLLCLVILIGESRRFFAGVHRSRTSVSFLHMRMSLKDFFWIASVLILAEFTRQATCFVNFQDRSVSGLYLIDLAPDPGAIASADAEGALLSILASNDTGLPRTGWCIEA